LDPISCFITIAFVLKNGDCLLLVDLFVYNTMDKQMSCNTRTNYSAVYLPLQVMFLLVAISIVSGQSPSGDRESLYVATAPSLYVATAPSSSLTVQTLAAPIFPRIPGSFTNAARNAAIDWNVVSFRRSREWRTDCNALA
jgi:hypothetical protein